MAGDNIIGVIMDPEIVREKIKKDIQTCIYGFLAKFQDRPFHYMTENDIQAELFVRMRDQINWSIDLGHESMRDYSFRKTLDLINTEYGEKIDIICLDPLLAQEEIKKKKNNGKKLSNFLWRLPVLIGIEIKLVRFDDHTKGINFCSEDAIKLIKFCKKQKINKDLMPSWLVLCFFHNKAGLNVMLNSIKNEHCMKLEDSLTDYDKIYLIDPNSIFQVTTVH